MQSIISAYVAFEMVDTNQEQGSNAEEDVLEGLDVKVEGFRGTNDGLNVALVKDDGAVHLDLCVLETCEERLCEQATWLRKKCQRQRLRRAC